MSQEPELPNGGSSRQLKESLSPRILSQCEEVRLKLEPRDPPAALAFATPLPTGRTSDVSGAEVLFLS